MADDKRITVIVDDKTHKAAKLEAAKEGKSISEIIRDLLSKWLGGSADEEQTK